MKEEVLFSYLHAGGIACHIRDATWGIIRGRQGQMEPEENTDKDIY